MTQSTLSAGIKELENILDQSLFIRGRKNITLTALGEVIAEQGEKILHDIDMIVARAKEEQEPMTGVFRLGVIPTIAPYFLPDILPYLKKDYPNLQLELYEDFSDRLITKLHKGTLDSVIMAFPYSIPNLEYQILFEEKFLLACPKGKKPNTKTVGITGLKEGELLLLEEGHCMTDHILGACDLQKPEHRKAYSATSLPTLIQMVSGGFGMTLLPEMVVKSSQKPDNIDITPFHDPQPTRKIGIARKTGTPKYHDTDTLYDAIMAYIDFNKIKTVAP